jgi:hypothetical protein
MKKFFVLGLLILVAGCALPFSTQLPAERPADFELEIYEGGGMLDQSTTWSITAGQATYTDHYEQRDVVTQFDLSDAELDVIWDTLRRARFDQIHQSEEHDVYDRGGTSIRVAYNQESVTKLDAGTTFISGGSADRFYAVRNAVTDLFNERLATLKQPVSITVDPTLLPNLQWLYLNGTVIYDVKTQTTLPAVQTLLPGDYVLAFSTLADDPELDLVYQSLTLTVPDRSITATLTGTANAPQVVIQAN